MSIDNFLSFYLNSDPKGEKRLKVKKATINKINELENRLSTLIPEENTLFRSINSEEINNTKKEIRDLKVILKK